MPPRRRPQRPSELVAASLRARIAAGEWAVDEPLPPTAALAEAYGVSQSTVSRAVRALVAEGVLVTVPRWGVFVAGGQPG